MLYIYIYIKQEILYNTYKTTLRVIRRFGGGVFVNGLDHPPSHLSHISLTSLSHLSHLSLSHLSHISLTSLSHISLTLAIYPHSYHSSTRAYRLTP